MGRAETVLRVEWVEMHYTDIVGRLRSVSVPYGGSGDLRTGIDGSSVGMAAVSSSDAVLVADMSTFSRIPWLERWGRVICDVYRSEGARHPMDPRSVAQRLEEYLGGMGLEVLFGAEVEFFLFRGLSLVLRPPTTAGYRLKLVDRAGRGPFSNYQAASDELSGYRAELAHVLSGSFGVKVHKHHHEVASGQVELSVGMERPTRLSDSVQTVKYVAKALAGLRGLRAVFMPKPLCGENGSGMHVHVSLWRGSRNVFYDPADERGLSQLARYFVGGLLHHARALAALVAPTVNSYRRLVPGFEAPVYAVWGYGNRSAAVRVPPFQGEGDARVEFRPPDPSACPYLAVAAIAMAGLDGIRKSMDPGEPLEGSAYELSRVPREMRLPSSLAEALDELSSDREFLKPVFPEELVEAYIEVKRREVTEVTSAPSPVEFLMYQDV